LGDVNPSGRLAWSWPKSYADTAVAQCGSYNATNVTYNERFYVGYRWHDAKKIDPLFPFGYGLSYTTWKYGNVKVGEWGTENGELRWKVAVEVSNTGKVAGREVVQLYVSYPGAKVERCVKELKAFAKTRLLNPGESETVQLSLSLRDLAYWDEFAHCFRTDPGEYSLLVGVSSSDIRSCASLNVQDGGVFSD
jgi:beta-glucosidase